MALHYEDFDILGVIKLQPDEVEGIEEFVTPVRDKEGNIDHYLSRSPIYYKEGLTYSDRQKQHNHLASLLQAGATGKKAFVIAENMLNNSARVYYNEAIKKIFNFDKCYDKTRECFLEDCKLVRSILHGEDEPEYTKHTIPSGDDITEGRAIELDNKVLLDLFVRSLEFKDPNNTTILNPGLGSIYLGPFVNLEYGINWENIYMSFYAKNKGSASTLVNKLEASKSSVPVKQRIVNGEASIATYMTNPEQYYHGTHSFIVLDDNMGTGETSKTISIGLKREFDGCQVDQMSVMNNWVNYAKVYNGKVKNGESVQGDVNVVESGKEAFENILMKHNSDYKTKLRTDITYPDLTDANIFRSPLNFPDYHVLKAAISSLTENEKMMVKVMKKLLCNMAIKIKIQMT